MFGNRDSKLRFLKIMHDIERNLAGYLTVVTIINAAVGIIVAIGAWLIGLPNPVIFGVLAALLNYVPYVGPAVMVMVLFGVGLVTFPSLGHAFIAPIGLDRAHHHGRTFRHPDHRRAAADAQSAAGVSWRWRSGPGCGARSARCSPCRYRSSASSSSTICFRPKKSGFPSEWNLMELFSSSGAYPGNPAFFIHGVKA